MSKSSTTSAITQQTPQLHTVQQIIPPSSNNSQDEPTQQSAIILRITLNDANASGGNL